MGIESVRVVEYLEISMSKELLSKFSTSSSSPSDLTLDFNYSESSIWSPLVKPRLPPLRQVDNHEKEKNKKKKKISTVPLRKQTVVQNLNIGLDNMIKQSSNKKMKMKTKTNKRLGDLFDSSPAPLLPSSYSPAPKKRWANILKVGPKCFKNSSKKKDHAASHLSLSNCFLSSMV